MQVKKCMHFATSISGVVNSMTKMIFDMNSMTSMCRLHTTNMFQTMVGFAMFKTGVKMSMNFHKAMLSLMISIRTVLYSIV
jgi:hypothetical protein